MKNLLLTISALLGMQLAVAQSVATNFTVEDCDGEMYDLFQELDAGKVVVITWIMPCAPCISPTVNTYLVAQEYEQDKNMSKEEYIERLKKPREALWSANPDYVIDDLNQLPQIINHINNES